MGKKDRIPWVFDYSGPPSGLGLWGRRLLGHAWELLEKGAGRLKSPGGASLALFLVAMLTAYFAYPIVFPGPSHAPVPEPASPGAAGDSVTATPLEPPRDPVVVTPLEPAAAPETGATGQRAPAAIAPTLAALVRPVTGTLVAGPGWRKDPVHQDWRFHGGVDLAAGGDPSALSAWGGRVTAVRRGVFGCPGEGPAGEVEVSHPGGWTSRYRVPGEPLVAPGQSVDNGTPLIRIDGAMATLHFELRKDGEYINPGWGAAD